MQQPLEGRVVSLEDTARRHYQMIARLDAIIENHDQMMDRLQANQETLRASHESLLANQKTLEANHEALVGLLEELTREAATTRRFWLRLAQRYGWLDDEQNGAQPNTPT